VRLGFRRVGEAEEGAMMTFVEKWEGEKEEGRSESEKKELAMPT
jgi:hypothetical protein